MDAALLIVAGAVYVAAIIGVTRIVARFVARFIPIVREEFVYAFSLASTAYQYVSWAQRGGQPTDTLIEWAGFALFGTLAAAGLRWPSALATGWLLHVVWDYAVHPMPATFWVPAWFPDFCVGFDIPLGLYIAMKARGRLTAAQLRASIAAGLVTALTLGGAPAHAQEHDHSPGQHHAATMEPAVTSEAPAPAQRPFVAAILHHAGSGTSVEPPSSPIPMLMGRTGGWMWMVHGNLVIADVEQNSPASRDKVLSNNWLMPMLGRKLGPGLFTARTMVSLEPATSRFTGAPEPYQAAHDLFVEIAATYDLPVTRNLLLSFYGAPVGEPALGPSAFIYRLSAADNPMLPLSHSVQDAAHQSRDVLTAGVTYKQIRAEVSGFHGRGPDADRIAIEQGAIDSWSSRVTVSLARNWTMQLSGARLTSPDAVLPNQDVRRLTASAAYTRPLKGGYWASTLSWGRDDAMSAPITYDSYLAESTLKRHGHVVWGRVETADRFIANHIAGVHRQGVFAIPSYTAGYAREVRLAHYLETAVGAQVTSYKTPALAAPVYGPHPSALTVFIRVRPNAH